jgi:aspartyl-tRNA(Asn)/glutamyl-tRNA(Gln) amidotransferase subunit A
MITEAFTLHAPWMRERFMDYGELFRDRVAPAATVSGPDLVQALRRRRVLCQEMAAAMANLDIIVSASQPGEAPRIDALTKWANMEKPSFTMPFNVTGFPAISVCTGFGIGGLPVAMQMAGKPFAEPLLFRAAHAHEIAMPWRGTRPAMAE